MSYIVYKKDTHEILEKVEITALGADVTVNCTFTNIYDWMDDVFDSSKININKLKISNLEGLLPTFSKTGIIDDRVLRQTEHADQLEWLWPSDLRELFRHYPDKDKDQYDYTDLTVKEVINNYQALKEAVNNE